MQRTAHVHEAASALCPTRATARTSLSRLSSKLSLFLRWLRMNSAMGFFFPLLLPSWARLNVPSLFSFLQHHTPGLSKCPANCLEHSAWSDTKVMFGGMETA